MLPYRFAPWQLFDGDILSINMLGIRAAIDCSLTCCQDPSTDVGARNIRRVAAACCGTTSGFEAIHSLVVGAVHRSILIGTFCPCHGNRLD